MKWRFYWKAKSSIVRKEMAKVFRGSVGCTHLPIERDNIQEIKENKSLWKKKQSLYATMQTGRLAVTNHEIWQQLTWICTMRATHFWQWQDFGNIWRSSPSLRKKGFLHRNVSRKSCWLKFICQWSNFKFYRSKSASATSALSNKIFESAQEKNFTQHWLSVGSCLVFLFFHKGIAAQIIYNWQTKLINLPAASRISFINVLQTRLGQLCEWPIIDFTVTSDKKKPS